MISAPGEHRMVRKIGAAASSDGLPVGSDVYTIQGMGVM
jgi:hypothetical protein